MCVWWACRLWEIGKSEPIKIGKASPTEGALPASLYLALRYQHSLRDALVANAGLGGDSAARGVVIGMLLGGQHGRKEIPVVELIIIIIIIMLCYQYHHCMDL
jgi:hypothetical protein